MRIDCRLGTLGESSGREDDRCDVEDDRCDVEVRRERACDGVGWSLLTSPTAHPAKNCLTAIIHKM